MGLFGDQHNRFAHGHRPPDRWPDSRPRSSWHSTAGVPCLFASSDRPGTERENGS